MESLVSKEVCSVRIRALYLMMREEKTQAQYYKSLGYQLNSYSTHSPFHHVDTLTTLANVF